MDQHARNPRTVTVIEHEAGCPLDRFEGWLAEAGVGVRVVRPYRGQALPEELPPALIVLGGAMSAHADDVAPWLPAVRRTIARCRAEDVPTLGICLGAQLVAAACGGRVEVGAPAGREVGVVDLTLTPQAASDPLFAGLGGPLPGAQLHSDAVAQLPPGATLLASSTTYPHQAFRLGSVWGVQFHPECSPQVFAGWAREEGVGDAVVQEVADRDAELAAVGRSLALAFARLLPTPSPGPRRRPAG